MLDDLPHLGRTRIANSCGRVLLVRPQNPTVVANITVRDNALAAAAHMIHVEPISRSTFTQEIAYRVKNEGSGPKSTTTTTTSDKRGSLYFDPGNIKNGLFRIYREVLVVAGLGANQF